MLGHPRAISKFDDFLTNNEELSDLGDIGMGQMPRDAKRARRRSEGDDREGLRLRPASTAEPLLVGGAVGPHPRPMDEAQTMLGTPPGPVGPHPPAYGRQHCPPWWVGGQLASPGPDCQGS